MTLSASAAIGLLLVLPTERFRGHRLDVTGGRLAPASIAGPVMALAALFSDRLGIIGGQGWPVPNSDGHALIAPPYGVPEGLDR